MDLLLKLYPKAAAIKSLNNDDLIFLSNYGAIRMNKEEKIEFFKKQIEIEKKIVKTAYESVKGIDNVLVREMLLSVINDSEKHENMLVDNFIHSFYNCIYF